MASVCYHDIGKSGVGLVPFAYSAVEWAVLSLVGGINRFIEALTGEFKYDLSIHFACGAGSYIFQDPDGKIVPLTRFVDATGMLEHLQNAVNEMEGKSKQQRKYIALKAVTGIKRYIDSEKQPKSVNFTKLLMSVVFKHDFATMGKFQLKSLFLGMMHFQDEYTYDIKRVEKCDIHYAMPDGRVLPFCTFNVFPEVYRDKIQRQYAIPSKEWKNMHSDWNYGGDKYVRNVKEIEATEAYQRTYAKMIDYFSLPVNRAEAVSVAAKTGRTYPSRAKSAAAAPTRAPKIVIASDPKEEHSHEGEGDSCGCGTGAGGCGCGKSESAESCGSGSGSCGCGGK